MPLTRITSPLISIPSNYPLTGSLNGTASYATTASFAMNGGSGGSGGTVQTGSIANQTILYNVTTSQDNIISGLNLSSNKWDVSVIEEWNSGSGDIYYPSSSVLLHFSGSNNSTTISDSGPNNVSITVSGGAKITSSFSKFGGTSLFLGGTNGNYLTIPVVSGGPLDVNNQNFTVECYIYITDTTTGTIASRYNSNAGSGNYNWDLSLTSTGKLQAAITQFNNNNSSNTITGLTTLTTNIWHHIAYVKSSSLQTLFLNGNIDVSGSITIATSDSGQAIRIGASVNLNGSTNAPIAGYIDEFRITKNVVRYTGSFTTSSLEFPNQLPQYETKYVGLVGGLNDTGSDYGVQKLSDSSLKIRKMSVSGTPVSGSPFLSASVDRVYVNVLDYTNVMVTSSNALTSSYAITSSYLTDGSQILTSDRTVAFSSSFTTAQMQALIDAQPKNLGGKTLTFQFADGNYNLSTGLQFNFFSNGVLLIYGNSSNNTVAAAKNVTLSGSSPIYLGQNNTTTEVNYLRLAINTSTYASALGVENTNTLVNYCSFTNYPTSVVVGSGNGIGVQARSAVWVRNSYFTSLDRYMVSLYNGIITADTNSQGTNSNIAYLAYGGIIQVQNTGLTGTTTYSTSVGGLIVRPSGTTVGT